MFTIKGRTYTRPILCCRKCSTPVFRLPEDANVGDKIADTIMRSDPIHPQDIPRKGDRAICSTCGVNWYEISYSFDIKDGVEEWPTSNQ